MTGTRIAPREPLRPRAARAVGRGLRTLMPGSGPAPRRAGFVALLAGLLVAVAASIRLLLPGPVGMADDGSGQSLLCGLGLGPDAALGTEPGHLVTRWVGHDWYGEACTPSPTVPALSPFFALVGVARLATGLLEPGTAFDTRVFAVLLAAVLGTLMGLIFWMLPGRLAFRILVVGGASLLLLDGVFVDFFDSADVEGVVLLGVLGMAVALLALWRGPRPRWESTTGAGLAMLAIVAVDLRLAVLLPVMVGALLWRGPRSEAEPPEGRRSAAGRGARRRGAVAIALLGRAPAILVALGLVGGTVGLAASLDRPAAAPVWAYQQVFDGILPSSPRPAQDLAWFGLPSSTVSAAGASPDSAQASSALEAPGLATIGPAQIAAFYATHPERLVGLSDAGLAAMTAPEQAGRGSYPVSAGEPAGAKEHRMPLALGLLGGLHVVTLLVPLLQLFIGLLGVGLAIRRERGVAGRAWGRTTTALMLAAGLLFWRAAVFDRADLSAAILPAALLTVLALPLAVGCVLMLVAAPQKGVKSAARSVNPKWARMAAAQRIAARPSP